MSGMRTPTPAAEMAAFLHSHGIASLCCLELQHLSGPMGTHLPAAGVAGPLEGGRARACHKVATMSCKHTMKFWKEAAIVVGHQGTLRAASFF